MSSVGHSRQLITHRNLPLLLLQTRELVIAHFRPLLNANDITEQQWRIVRVLVETGPLEPREIGEYCRLSSPSLAGVLARMDELGFVTRKRLAHDQRRVRVSLTTRSHKLAARIAPQIEATYRQLDRLLGADLSLRFNTALDDAIAALKPRAPPQRFPQYTTARIDS
jgi:homoprotocatechuate degradation regulator HpaR